MFKLLIFLTTYSVCLCADASTNPCYYTKCTASTICQVDPKTGNAACVPIVKPGTCPTPVINELLICNGKYPCTIDADCPGDKKCCKYGCQLRCLDPCPVVACKCPYGTEFYVENGCQLCRCKPNPCIGILCKRNTHCEVDPNTLQAICVPNIKPGYCPNFLIKAPCAFGLKPLCQSDFDCPDNQKCCSNPCQLQCVDACVDDISQCKCDIGLPFLATYTTASGAKCQRCTCHNPCAVTTCPEGTSCVVKNVECIKAPCPPQAFCEPNHCKFGTELPNVSCGRLGTTCPEGRYCEIASNDAYAVCCLEKNPCDGACKAGERCVLQDVVCIKAPCNPVPVCLSECPLYKCPAIECPNGIAYDINGCPTCDCLE